MNVEKMKEVFADEAFVKSLFELDSAAEVQAALKEKGIEMTEDEILGIRDLLAKMESGEISAEQAEQWSKQAESGELPDELLEQVSGGEFVILAAVTVGIGTFLKWIGIGVAVGAAAGGAAAGTVDAVRRRW